jgi:hypothetical protein
MIMRLLIFILLLPTIMLMGCEVKAPNQLQFDGISWEKSNWKEKQLFIRCSLFNPNNRKLKIKNADLKIIVEGIELGSLTTSRNINLDPLKRTTFDALLRIKPIGLGQLAPIIPLKHSYNLRIEGAYHVSGKSLSIQQNLRIDPEAEAYKGVVKIFQQLLDKNK